MHLRSAFLVIGSCTSFASMQASAEPLNVKTGLWEITTTMQTKGVPPLPKELLQGMTPEQRQAMEAQIRAKQGPPEVEKDRECITQRDLERPFESGNTKECKNTIVASTRTTQQLRIECSGEMAGSGSFKVTATSTEAITGVLDMKIGQGAESMTISGQVKGRWLGSECGDAADDDEDEESDESDDRG